MWTVAFLPSLVLKTLVGVFLNKPKAERFGHIRLETLVVVVDGCLASDDWLPFCRVGLFFPDEKVELINVLQGYIVKGLELGDGHIVLVHLHGDKDMFKLGYYLLDFLVDDNGTRMVHHQSILPLADGDTMF